MTKLWAFAWLALASCGSSESPRLSSVEPAAVTSLVASPVALHGEALDVVVAIDLDHDTAPVVDRGWKVAVGATTVDATWRDRTQIDLTIPAGLAAGTYDVTATSPAGATLVLHDALTISAEPIGLLLSIEDAPDGTGHPVTADLVAGDSLEAYATVRDRTGAFVGDVAAEWSTTAAIGTLAPAASAVQLHAEKVGTAHLVAHHAGAMLDAESGDVVVRAATPIAIEIVDDPTTGSIIGNRSGLTTDGDGGLIAHAASVDAFGNFVATVPVAWSLTGVTASLPPTDTTMVAIDFATPGTGVLTATHPTLGAAATGTLDVVAGRAAQLAVTPPSLSISADAMPVAFAATAKDADGNATTNLGTLTWSIASGPITALDPLTGMLTPAHAGSGAIHVVSSHGAAATSGSIDIVAGAPVALAIAPTSLAVTADDPPTVFTATATDADGNPTAPGTVTWTIDAGAITSLEASGVLNPQHAGTGAIRASVPGATATAAVTIAPGHAAAFDVTPASVDLVEGGLPVMFTATATDADGNATTDTGTLVWSATGPIAAITQAGMFTPMTPGDGTVRVASSYGSTGSTGAVRVLRRAALAASLAVDAQVGRGAQPTATLTVTNTGEVAAATVTPCALTVGAGASIAAAPPATPSTLAPGETTTYAWTLATSQNGSVQLSGCVTGSDTATSAAVISNTATASFAIVDPADFAATLALPDPLSRGADFTVTMRVTNIGAIGATGVSPSALVATGTGTAMVISSPSASESIAPGASVTFSWTYRATARGTLQLTGSVSDGAISKNAISNTASIVEVAVVDASVFADGTTTGYLASHGGMLYVGPNKTGSTVMTFSADGTTQQSATFAFAKDTIGNKTSNPASPLTSLGAIGCSHDTVSCGPDNEELNGAIDAVTFGGTDWLTAWNGTTKGTAYLYMTPDTDAVLDFRYVDLTSTLASGTTTGISALAGVGSSLYIGLSGKTTSSATLIALTTTPVAPGLDATSTNAINMRLDRLPGWTSIDDPEGVDAIGNSGGIVYLANKNAWVRATTISPQPIPAICGTCFPDWTTITPTATAYTARASRAVLGAVRMDARDRAVPQIVTFGGNLFVARNTTVGPQLWTCNPTFNRCSSSDWRLVAPNSTGDALLTQFNDASLTSITMLVATPSLLYVGFDSAAGVRVFRSTNAAAAVRADFEGLDGCSAAQHPATCGGFGGNGFGDPNNTRIFDAKVVGSRVWMTVGDGTVPAGLVMVP
ncbi:MAG: hypothetical protein HOV81_42395 [Kofleriaceae bacterium]|nr:hypothetical protein [Kofleriaceae bacterium]